jgi:hypothetical protein
VIRLALEPHGLYKASLKQGDIVLAFISPQVGQRHLETINQLSQQTGYRITLHPHPNQQQILQIAGQLMSRAGWVIRKGAGIHTDRAEVVVALANTPDEASLQQVRSEFTAQTGYTLVVS